LQGWQAAPGRLECVRSHPLAFVDYAHTPDALDRTLTTARRFVGAAGRLIVVFGAGGNRDRAKRGPMGRVAGELADIVILTNDNPRDEEPAAIAAAIAAGAPPQTPVLTELDRAKAIRQALTMAGPTDVVVVAGKGHETVQEVRGAQLPFDDREEIRTWGIQ
jgi:UDP-N-acetylmuramoyl-L-alanyl-D-glutamate--2,6-diaminopimelate ligase